LVDRNKDDSTSIIHFPSTDEADETGDMEQVDQLEGIASLFLFFFAIPHPSAADALPLSVPPCLLLIHSFILET